MQKTGVAYLEAGRWAGLRDLINLKVVAVAQCFQLDLGGYRGAMKTAVTLLLSLLLVSSCRGEDFCKDKICPEFKVIESSQVGLRSCQAGRHSPEESRKLPQCFCVRRILRSASMSPPLGLGQRSKALPTLTF